MSLQAKSIAARYGRQLDIVEAWKQIQAEKELESKGTNTWEFHLAEGMYNIPAYSNPKCVIVSQSRQLQVMQWELVPRNAKEADVAKYSKGNWFKNARAEDIFTTWPYRNNIRKRRCLIPSTGYFEYHYFENGIVQPFFLYIPTREEFAMAGIWDRWPIPGKGEDVYGDEDIDNPDFEKYIYSFTQITTKANDFAAKVHNGGKNPFRMPLILKQEDEERWLDPNLTDDEIKSLMVPYTEQPMAAYPVAKNFKDQNPYDKRLINKEKPPLKDTDLELDFE